MIYQDFKLLSNKTVFENIAFAMEVAGRSTKDIRVDTAHVIDLVGLKGKENFFPHQLSGGEKQRTAIARAIVNNPDLILADEPTGNLDRESSEDVIEILKKVNKFGTTIILTTHDPRIVNMINGRVIVMDRGRIISDSGNEKLLDKNIN